MGPRAFMEVIQRVDGDASGQPSGFPIGATSPDEPTAGVGPSQTGEQTGCIVSCGGTWAKGRRGRRGRGHDSSRQVDLLLTSGLDLSLFLHACDQN